MASHNVQETLDRILADLRSDENTRQLAAIHELGTINYSSEAILHELEQLALGEENAVQKLALAALSLKTNQNIASKLSKQTKFYRNLILKEIDEWQADELIESRQAEVLRRHYDFDIKPTASVQALVGAALEPEVAQQSRSVQGSEQNADQGVQQPLTPAGPRPSLMQTLLSEASIKVYLYLGAFFVIASALILAAIVEAARLPILVVATLAFGGGSLIIRKRLPQPSFALFIVFSFLLLIDANVIEETLALREPNLSIYWMIVLMLMAFIWALSIWFYNSRFFSMVAFASLSLAFYRAGEIFRAETELNMFLLMLSALVGLGGTSLLKRWKDDKFASPLFWLIQAQTIFLLMASFILSTTHAFEPGFASGWWILIALTWLAAASFYALSDFLSPFILFPWMAVGTLLPIPWLFLNMFDVTQPVYAFGFWMWGMIVALASEVAFRLSPEQVKKFHWPLLTGSAPLFLMSFSIVLYLYWEKPVLAFAIFGLTALVYVVLHILRPRWYVWSAALLSSLSAYFIFFYKPIIEGFDVAPVYQLLIASLLLAVPELFTKSPLSIKSPTRQPLIVLGILVSFFALVIALTDFGNTGRSALVLIVYAVLFTLHALHGKQNWLGYFATAAASLAIVYALDHFNLDLWLPALTLMSVLYYAVGFLIRRAEDKKTWGNVLINSGLALGALVSVAALLLSAPSSGWYIIIVAVLFTVEVFARPLAWLEVAVEVLMSISLYRILNDFNVTSIVHFLFGVSLIWLGGDLIFGRTIKEKRQHGPFTLVTGYVLVLMSTLVLWGELNPAPAAIYFALYAIFLALYAFLQQEPRLGYLAAPFLPMAMIKLYDVLNFEKWTFPLIALAVLYYALGFWLRRIQKAKGWGEMLVFSGLGLGILTSFATPVQGGLDVSIPVAIAATLFAAEAFALRKVWWALPANILYLMSYFMILIELKVEEPQFYSIGAALLGILMNYLLSRAGSKTGAFIAGMLSQLVLLGTTYIQMVSTSELSFFFVLFAQSLVILAYGIIMRSRSLVIAPISFVVLGVMTVLYSALKDLSLVVIIGVTGIVLLLLGILAVVMRERITTLAERFSDWNA